MKEKTTVKKSDVTDNKAIKIKPGQPDSASALVINNPGFELLTAEGNDDLVNYIEWLGLDKDPNLVVLSSIHHYYYDIEEMKNVSTVINLLNLNQVKDIRSFFHSVFHILAQKSNFIGYFADSKKENGSTSGSNHSESIALENGIISKIPILNKIFNLMDSRTNKTMSRNGVSLLLEEHGFEVLDMTELNGITYFHAKRI